MDSIEMLIRMSGVGSEDTVLDVACGPGLVACEFARHCAEVTGLDITPAMIEQAQKTQTDKGLTNMSWNNGTALPLPYADNSFSCVITRYSFHHFNDVKGVLSEMVRVCRPGGKVLAADVRVEPDKSEAYDRLEKIRDPSHVHALTGDEYYELFYESGLKDCVQSSYGVDIELEEQIRASFPEKGMEQVLRDMVTSDIGVNRLGINAREKDGKIIYTVPVGIYTGTK